MNRKIVACAVFGVLVSGPVFSEVAPWYVSGSVGQSDFKINDSDLSPITVRSKDKKDTQFGVAAGYRLSPNVALELGYLDFGKAKLSGSFQSAGVSGDYKATSVHVSALLTAPISDAWSIYGRIGAARTDRKASFSVVGISGSASEKKTEALYGVGIGYAFSSSLATTLEYMKLNDTDVSAISFGVRLSF